MNESGPFAQTASTVSSSSSAILPRCKLTCALSATYCPSVVAFPCHTAGADDIERVRTMHIIGEGGDHCSKQRDQNSNDVTTQNPQKAASVDPLDIHANCSLRCPDDRFCHACRMTGPGYCRSAAFSDCCPAPMLFLLPCCFAISCEGFLGRQTLVRQWTIMREELVRPSFVYRAPSLRQRFFLSNANSNHPDGAIYMARELEKGLGMFQGGQCKLLMYQPPSRYCCFAMGSLQRECDRKPHDRGEAPGPAIRLACSPFNGSCTSKLSVEMR